MEDSLRNNEFDGGDLQPNKEMQHIDNMYTQRREQASRFYSQYISTSR